MLHSYNDLSGYAIRAADGQKGRVDDIYFDDSNWQIRYLVVKSGFLLTGRQGLISNELMGHPDTGTQELPVALSKEEVADAAPAEAEEPVSKQARPGVAADVPAWPSFLVGTGYPYSPNLAMDQLGMEHPAPLEPSTFRQGDPHLRSMAEVKGYAAGATDGDMGSVLDFLIDPDGWHVRYFVIDTGNWLPGRRVVATTRWISRVDWADQKIHLDVDGQTVKDAPRFKDLDHHKRSDAQEAIERHGNVGFWPI